MLSSSHRFHGRGGPRQLHTTGLVVRGQGISLKYTDNKRVSSYRAAVVVSKKVSKLAVVRNRIRRRIYEQLRLQLPGNIQADIAVMVYDNHLADIPTAQLAEMIASLIAKAGLARPVSIDLRVVRPEGGVSATPLR